MDPLSDSSHYREQIRRLNPYKDLQKIKLLCSRAVLLDEKNSSLYCLWADKISDAGNYEESFPKYRHSTIIDTQNDQAFNNWGLALSNIGNHDEAVIQYEKSYIIAPGKLLIHKNWGASLRQQGKYDEAIELYKRGLEINNQDADTYNNWGVTLYHQRKYEEAIEKFEKAIDIDPTENNRYFNWGLALHQQENFAEATKMYEKGVWRTKEFGGQKKKFLEAITVELVLLAKKKAKAEDEGLATHIQGTIDGMTEIRDLLMNNGNENALMNKSRAKTIKT